MSGNRINVRVTYGESADSGARGKNTNPGWPDPTDWFNRFEAELRERAEIYLTVTAQRNREPGSYTDDGMTIESACTVQAAAVLSSISKALAAFPVFRKHPAATAVNDLVFALHDLALGKSPALLRRGGRRRDATPVGHETVGGYVTLSVRLLREGHGYSDAAARSEVAKIFAKSGWLGRKGDVLSASTLQDWQDRYAGLPADHPVREGIERLWDEWTDDPNWLIERDHAAAISWVKTIAASPELQNKVMRKRG